MARRRCRIWNLQKRLVELFFDKFSEARRIRHELSQNETFIENILAQGAQRAHEIATPLWHNVAHAVGIRS